MERNFNKNSWISTNFNPNNLWIGTNCVINIIYELLECKILNVSNCSIKIVHKYKICTLFYLQLFELKHLDTKLGQKKTQWIK